LEIKLEGAGEVRRTTQSLVEYSFIAPMVIFLVLFIAYPIFMNIRISFQDLKAANLMRGDVDWVGFENYDKILNDRFVKGAANHLFFFTAFSLLFQIPCGLALALFFKQNFPGAKWMRGLFLLTWTIPLVVIGVIFRWLFDTQFGVMNWIVLTLGLAQEKIQWLTGLNWVMTTLVVINIWLGIPFNLALILAGLQSLPNDVYEAATVDGANKRQQFWHITLPLLRPTLWTVFLLGLIYTLRTFDLIWTVTQGGPFDASQVPSTIAYRRIFGQFRFGEGAAILNLLFLLLLGIAAIYVWSIRGEETE
jgi:multiple sugar transport system permease protein